MKFLSMFENKTQKSRLSYGDLHHNWLTIGKSNDIITWAMVVHSFSPRTHVDLECEANLFTE